MSPHLRLQPAYSVGMLRSMLLLLSLSASAYAVRTSLPLSRRAALHNAGLAAFVVPLSAESAQRGAEDAYATQVFDNSICTERTALGACKGSAKPDRAAPSTFKTLQVEAEPESELVKNLLAKSAENAEINQRIVREKTVAAGLSGTYGPFAKTVPIMRSDGNFEDISFARYDKLKDRGKIYKTATGLDAYVAGFDPDAPEPQRDKIMGLF